MNQTKRTEFSMQLRNIIVQINLTLDGFIEGSEEELDWQSPLVLSSSARIRTASPGFGASARLKLMPWRTQHSITGPFREIRTIRSLNSQWRG